MALLEKFAVVNLVLIYCLMTGLGASLDLDDFRSKLEKPKPVIFGMSCQFILFPLIMLAAVNIFSGFPVHYRIALTIVVTCPGGTLSNMICYLFKADLSLSLMMTTVSSILAIGMIPLNLFVYLELVDFGDGDNGVRLDWAAISFTCGIIVTGLATGIMLKKNTTPKNAKRVEFFGIAAGMSTFFVGLWRNSSSETPAWALPSGVYLSMIFTTMLAALLCFLAARYAMRLPKSSVVAVMVEVVVQNTNLALAIASLSIDDQVLVGEMIGVIIVWGMFHAVFSGGPALILWKLGWTDMHPRANPFGCIPGCPDPRFDNDVENDDSYIGKRKSREAMAAPSAEDL